MGRLLGRVESVGSQKKSQGTDSWASWVDSAPASVGLDVPKRKIIMLDPLNNDSAGKEKWSRGWVDCNKRVDGVSITNRI